MNGKSIATGSQVVRYIRNGLLRKIRGDFKLTISVRALAILFFFVISIAGNRESYADVFQFSFSASPEVKAQIGTTRHAVSIDTKKHVAIVRSYDVSGRLVSELTALKDGYTLSRYVVGVAGAKVTDKVVFNSKGKQVSLIAVDEKDFKNWTTIYGAELKKNMVPKMKTTKSTLKLTCENKCLMEGSLCAILGSPCWFCELVCAASFAYCWSQCPDYGVGQDYPGNPTGEQCGMKWCSDDEQCCKGDWICVPKTGGCK